MRCSGCGEEISFLGEVCPHCLRDKSADQKTYTIVMIYVFIFGVAGYLFSGIALGLVGCILGGLIGLIVDSKSGIEKTEPPKVQIIDNEPNTSSINKTDISIRLQNLESIKAKGLITEEEYKSKRAEIIKNL